MHKTIIHDRDAGFYQIIYGRCKFCYVLNWGSVAMRSKVEAYSQIPKGLYVGMTLSYIKTKYDK